MKKRQYILIAITVVLLLITIWTIWGNLTVRTSIFEINDKNLPDGFENYRIAQISDLHNAEFGKDNSMLLKILQKEQPDIIIATGDLVDSRNTNIDIAVSFVEQAIKIAPFYLCYRKP